MADEVWRRSLRSRLNYLARDAGAERTDPAELRDILGDELCARWDVPGNGTVEAVRKKTVTGLEDLIQRFVSDDAKLTIRVSYNMAHVPSESAEGWKPRPKESLTQRRKWLWDKDNERFLIPPRTASRILETFLDNAASYLENGQPQPGPHKSSSRRRLAIAGATLLTAGASVGLTVFAMHLSHGNPARTIPDAEPRSASASNQPILVEGVTPLANDNQGLYFAVPEKLDMTPTGLDVFNKAVSTTAGFDTWYKSHKAITLGNSTTHITLVGNVKDGTAIITDMKVIKQCHAPDEATVFFAPGGGDTANTPMTFDLDKVDPYAQDATGAKFFGAKSISLAYNDPETLAVDIHTTSECTFTFQLSVATPNGTLLQTVDNYKQPFEITSFRDPVKTFSSYQEVYSRNHETPGSTWQKMDPHLLP